MNEFIKLNAKNVSSGELNIKVMRAVSKYKSL